MRLSGFQGRDTGCEVTCVESAAVKFEDARDFLGLGRADLTRGHGLQDGAGRLHEVRQCVDGREIERNGPVLPGRAQSVEAEAHGWTAPSKAISMACRVRASASPSSRASCSFAENTAGIPRRAAATRVK